MNSRAGSLLRGLRRLAYTTRVVQSLVINSGGYLSNKDRRNVSTTILFATMVNVANKTKGIFAKATPALLGFCFILAVGETVFGYE